MIFIVSVKNGLKELIHTFVVRYVTCIEIGMSNCPYLVVLGEPIANA